MFTNNTFIFVQILELTMLKKKNFIQKGKCLYVILLYVIGNLNLKRGILGNETSFSYYFS